ncbi:ABC transporter ATP-binding protein [Candidatus Tokpelaia sp.]|uniref:ABC transporter ATP-binding protein n=1 Tax=Candidatus Tokpelaia sp. TaxID=2233777 RepID=UPI00123BFFAD|nr:ABC transporter ATP-binding protein [Candidatus Tokpelaia sp.]KAA6406127.1 ABC transporter ATP-binding protein [Candidatus Tokpelaia sp.]
MARKVKEHIKITARDKALIVRLLRENFRKHALLYLGAMISMLFIAASTSASAWVMKDVVEATLRGHDFQMILFIAGAVAVIFITKGFSSFFQSFFLTRAGNSIVSEQQRKIYARLMQQGVGFYQKNASSDLLLRVTQNANSARSIIDTVVTTFVRDLFSVSGLLLVMLVQNFRLTIVALMLGPVAFLGVRIILQRVRGLMAKELSSLADIIKVMQETTIGIRVIKAFSLEDRMQQRMNKAITDVQRRANSIATLEAATGPVMETLAGLAIATVIVFSGYMASQQKGVEAQLMAFITALLLAYEPAKRLANVRVKIESGMIGVRMMFELIDVPLSLQESKNAEPLACPRGVIRFNNVGFAYIDDRYVLKNINLTFPAGKMTALVGPSGSGKSTMINLMMRLYDPKEGFIDIDGQDIKNVTFQSLRDHLSYVGQDTFLFEGSVYDNIAMGRAGATEEEVRAAAVSANAHEFIEKLPQGYQTNVGDNGGNLSGGQKQRLSIARAMLRNSKILILDEATSALDAQSEALIRDALDRLTKGRTTIVIAHRLSTIANADKIVVMKEGDIWEEGTEEELLAIDDGLYRELYELQFQNSRQALENMS